MAKPRKHTYKKKAGQIPGTAIYTGSKSSDKLFIEVFDYNATKCTEKHLIDISETIKYKESDSITWINLNGLSHVEEIEKLATHYEFHPLVLEDIVNISQRPKIDEYDNYLFVVLKMLYYDENEKIISEQVSFILGKDHVLSFQESEGDVFDEVRERIRHGKGRVRSMNSDYLLYVLIDAVVDYYFNIIEILGDKIEDFETDIFNGNAPDDVSQNIQNLKREILKVRRAIFPLRDIINRIEKTEHSLVSKQTLNYYRDVYDHLIQISENIDIYREMIWSLMDMYMTTISNKMNEVMKVLTIMSSIFIPLTFIAGIYGMNFNNIPELRYHNAYYILWAVMIAIFIGMLIYFKRKKWL